MNNVQRFLYLVVELKYGPLCTWPTWCIQEMIPPLPKSGWLNFRTLYILHEYFLLQNFTEPLKQQSKQLWLRWKESLKWNNENASVSWGEGPVEPCSEMGAGNVFQGRKARHRWKFAKSLQVRIFMAYLGDTHVTSMVEIDGSYGEQQ